MAITVQMLRGAVHGWCMFERLSMRGKRGLLLFAVAPDQQRLPCAVVVCVVLYFCRVANCLPAPVSCIVVRCALFASVLLHGSVGGRCLL